jgi:hypothetical protein
MWVPACQLFIHVNHSCMSIIHVYLNILTMRNEVMVRVGEAVGPLVHIHTSKRRLHGQLSSIYIGLQCDCMCACVYVYMCMCACVHVYMCMCTCVHVYMCMCTYTGYMRVCRARHISLGESHATWTYAHTCANMLTC